MMIGLEMKKYNLILTERHEKYQHYHQVKLINNEYLKGKEKLPSNQSS